MRPTSETIIDSFFAKWVQSYRDLPLLVNQWANVVRWELRPRLFLRTTEFLWQEGHTAHATAAGRPRVRPADPATTSTRDFMVNVLAMPVLRRAQDRTGALRRRHHNLDRRGDDARRQSPADGYQPRARPGLRQGLRHQLPRTNRASRPSPGRRPGASSTRLMGALVMAHGDDAGLRLPPRLAPVQAVVLAVRTEDGAGEAASRLVASLRDAGLRAELDVRTQLSFGRRVVEWELKGVPVRVEVGPRDLATGTVVLCRRDDATKTPVRLDDAVAEVRKLTETAQASLFAEARQRLEDNTVRAATLAEAEAAAETGFAAFPASLLLGDRRESGGQHSTGTAATVAAPGSAAPGEDRLNAGGISVRVLQRPDGTLPSPDEDVASLMAVAGRAY